MIPPDFVVYFVWKKNKQAKVNGSASHTNTFLGYDEYVPMVDKAVDAGWKKQASFKKVTASKG